MTSRTCEKAGIGTARRPRRIPSFLPGILAVALSFSALGAGVAHAQPAPGAHKVDPRLEAARQKTKETYPFCSRQPTDSDLKGAKGSHEAAKQYLERGVYDKAIQSWNEAYGFDCSRPSVFQNLSTAYEKKGDRAMTIALLEVLIERDPTVDKPTTQAKIDNLVKALSDEPMPTVAPDLTKVTAPPEKPRDPNADTHLERPFGPAPWITLGLGSAVMLSGIPVLVIGRGKVADAEKACPSHKNCSSDSQSTGNTGNVLTAVGASMIAGGGAIAIGSLVWQLAGNGEKRVPNTASRWHVTPSVGLGFTGATVDGRF